MKYLRGVLVLGLLAAACGSPPEQELVFNNYPIINGTQDTSQAHQAVVAVYDNYALCTGTWIGSDVVLTAGHCVSSRTMQVGFGNSMNWGMTWRTVTEKKVHPQYSATAYNIVNDIAMVRFSGSPPAGTTPIPHLPEALGVTTADIGTMLTYVGFGQTSASGGTTGVKMVMTNDLRWVCTSSGGCGYPAGYNTICEDQTPSGICSGDSGGPAIILRDNREYLAGVASYTGQNCAEFGCSTKVDEYDESFIRDWVGGRTGDSCSGAAQCDSGYCVDGVCCTTPCSGVCQACNLTASLGTCTTVPNGYECADNDLCDGTEVCQNGQCADGQPLNCVNSNPCTIDRCDPATGCVHDPVIDGTPCSNGNPCDGDETCQSGNCAVGDPKDCDDHNLCTQDSCDPASGCQHVTLQDGTGCGGGLCGSGVCTAGECVYADPTKCDDGDSCSQDWCEPDTGCQHEVLPDGYECGKCMMCSGAVCIDIDDCDEGCGCGAQSTPSDAVWILLAMFFLILGRRK